MVRHEIECNLIENRPIAQDIFILRLNAPQIAQLARPGQFCMLEVSGCADPLLKRPLSIHDVAQSRTEISFVYRVVGKGTAILAQKKTGDRLKVLGPLGNGFSFSQNQKPVLVGGGLGIAPMLFLARTISQAKQATMVILGARSTSELISLEAFRTIDCALMLATEDGSIGNKGFVTSHLKEVFATNKADKVFACGPMPMLKAVYEMAKEASISCEVSLETQMACGIGACLGCAVKSTRDTSYLHVCKEGPVFDAKDVLW